MLPVSALGIEREGTRELAIRRLSNAQRETGCFSGRNIRVMGLGVEVELYIL